jgi:hypothetical protein
MTQEEYIKYIQGLMKKEPVTITSKVKVKGFNSKNIKSIPIIINSYNRLSCLKELVDRLKSMDYNNIYIIDNNSTYEPLLNYYENENLNVFRMNKNVGFLSIWKTDIFKNFISNPYVYTDPDVIPIEQCPDNFIEHFYNLLKKYPEVDKVGFGLKLDDIPEIFKMKNEVIGHESQFWVNQIETNVYAAPVDTTFALYRPGKIGGFWMRGLRTGGDYLARHMGWYLDTNNPTEEDIFYKNSITQLTHWSVKD